MAIWKKRTKKKVDIPFFRATVDMLKSQIPKFPVTAPKTGICPPRLGSPDSMGHLRSFSRKMPATNGGFLYIYIYTTGYLNALSPYTQQIKWTYKYKYIYIYSLYHYTSRAARGGGGSFKNRKRIGEIGCCESRMTKQKHSWIELSNGVTDWLPNCLTD